MAAQYPAASNLYASWIDAFTELTPANTDWLAHMSSFKSTHVKSLHNYVLYANQWIALSKFLFAHKDKNIFSSKVQMSWLVEERKQHTHVYWFEVAHACDMLLEQTIIKLAQDAHVLSADSASKSFFDFALDLVQDDDTLTCMLTYIREAIGIAYYTLNTATKACMHLNLGAPRLMENIRSCYHTLRAAGCFVQGLHQMHLKQEQNAIDWLATCGHIAAGQKENIILKPFAASIDFLQWDPLESTCRHASLSIL